MILSAQSIRNRCSPSGVQQYYDDVTHQANPMITPFCERTVHNGKTFGLSSAGYDIRIAEKMRLTSFKLASTIEYFEMPHNILGKVYNKSTWARHGLNVMTTVIEPGWRGYLTLELVNLGHEPLIILEGDPIAQITFEMLDMPTEQPYTGKYQDQEAGPQKARHEHTDAKKRMSAV